MNTPRILTKTIFDEVESFIPFDQPIEFPDYTALGYFPYEKASIGNNSLYEVTPPRTLFKELEDRLGINDNKYVVIFRDKLHANTTNFAIYFKDGRAKLDTWHKVLNYNGQPLAFTKRIY